MIGFSRRLMMPADSAHLLLFHPDDLAHAAGWPRHWYRDAFAWGPETAAGTLVAWATGIAGSFAVRLTTGALSAREQAFAGPHWTFPYRVRHGRVYFDNGDALPSEARTASPSDNEEYWVKLPDGDYAVTVTGIEWQAEEGAADAPDKLPNYVVQFEEARGVRVGLALRPPDIVALSDAVASDALVGAVAETAMEAVPVDSAAYYPAFVCADTPRAGRYFAVGAEVPLAALLADGAGEGALLSHNLRNHYFIAAPRLEPGAVGMLCVLADAGEAGDAPEDSTPSMFHALAPVELLALDGVYQAGCYRALKREGWLRKRHEAKPDDALWAVRCRAWAVADDDAGADDIGPDDIGSDDIGSGDMARDANPDAVAQALRALLLDLLAEEGTGGHPRPLAARLGAKAGYHRRWIGFQNDPAALADWISDHAVTPAQGLTLSTLPPARRYAEAMRLAREPWG